DQPRADAVVGDAHRHGPDDPAVVVVQRHLAAGRAAQGAVVDLHDLVPGQGLAGVGGDVAADAPRVGVRPAHPVPVQHDDVLGAGGLPDPFGLPLDRPVGRGGRGPQVVGDPRLLG